LSSLIQNPLGGLDALSEYNIKRDIYPAGGHFETFVPLVHIAIPKNDTLFISKLEFERVVGTKVWPTRTTKYTERSIIWFSIK
jgi:hypothetical protein